MVAVLLTVLLKGNTPEAEAVLWPNIHLKWLSGKKFACNSGDLGWEDPLEEGMSTHSSILTWRIPWTEEPGGLQAVGSQSRTQLSTCAHLETRLPLLL